MNCFRQATSVLRFRATPKRASAMMAAQSFPYAATPEISADSSAGVHGSRREEEAARALDAGVAGVDDSDEEDEEDDDGGSGDSSRMTSSSLLLEGGERRPLLFLRARFLCEDLAGEPRRRRRELELEEADTAALLPDRSA